MDTKSLLTGLAGFILGGLVVSVAATKQKPVQPTNGMTMSGMTESLKGKTGDDFDRAFLSTMIEHHQGAIDMARLAETRAKHSGIKDLSRDIIAAQEREISQMKQWQAEWGYGTGGNMDMGH